MAETAYQKKLRADLEVLDGDLFLETRTDLTGFADNFDGTSFSAEELKLIVECGWSGDFSEVFRRDSQWTELPSGAGFVWRP